MSDTITEPVLKITRIFDAPPERVFDAWLVKEQWGAWIGPEGCRSDILTFEPRVGGRYHLVMHISGRGDMPVEGVFKTIVRPSSGKMGRFAFTWGWALSGKGETVVTVNLKPAAGGKTELTLIHEGLPTADDREGHGKGWNSTLNKLALFLNSPSGLRT
jgi:uncharacterized protein YndB with AHSA1/START domain